MSPKLVDKKAKKNTILKAAMKIFAQKGTANAKMSDIAKEANIGKGTIYEYFKSKEEIFKESFNYFQDELESNIARHIFKLTDPEEKLKAFIHSFADVFDDEKIDYIEIIFVFWAEGIRHHEEDKIEKIFDLKKMYSEYRKLIISILEEGIKIGKFKDIDTLVIASVLIGAMDGLILQWIMDKNLFSLKKSAEILADTIIKGIKKS